MRTHLYLAPFIAAVLTIAPACQAQTPAGPAPDPARFADADRLINDAVSRGDIPGAVLLVGLRGQTVYRKAYGQRAVLPQKTAMTTDTIFDMASITKVVATATSVMVLVDRGKLKLSDPVSKHIPEFAANGKKGITVEQLLLHRGGLVPDNHLNDYKDGPAKAMANVYALTPRWPPGTRFVYSDVGYIVLGELVRRIDGRPLDRFAREEVFEPLGLRHTTFKPPASWRPRIAPTEQREGKWMVGEVHDPRAYALGGVAGHAGLFTTADDLADYCWMILRGGTLHGKRILSQATIDNMTRPRWLADGTNGRALGWDVDTGYSSPRGQRFPRGRSFGHTGFTGTSMWLVPERDCFVILLTNRVHPNGKGRTVQLRRDVATAVADAFFGPRKTDSVLSGVDVLKREGFKQLAGRKVALITNHTGRDREGNRTIDVLHEAKNVELVKIFSPEHGLFAALEGSVGDTKDVKTGIPVLSLYGKTRRPTADMLEGADTIVFDIQDVGTRFYTYITTMGYAMEAAAKHKVRFVVLDRPNPIAPVGVAGPTVDKDRLGFIAYKPIPLVHGMTVGEMATLFNKEHGIGCELRVVKMQGWKRSMWFDETGLTWINPSPNMRNATQALLYPAVGLLERTNVSVGRGADQPFELFGAPWINGPQLAAALNHAALPGLRFVPIEFTPNASKFKGEKCQGVYLIVTDRAKVQPARAGVALAWHLNELYGRSFEIHHVLDMMGDMATYESLRTARKPTDVANAWSSDLRAFERVRAKYLLYR